MTCSFCDQEMPPYRHGNSLYCSEDCAIEVRAINSSMHYHERNDLFIEYKNNEAILRKFHQIFLLGHEVYYHQLKDVGFNFDFSVRGTLGPNREICKVIGEYKYHLNLRNKTVSIWPLI